MTTSARQLTGTSAKCHSIGTRWVCMAAWALDSTIHDTGAAKLSTQAVASGASLAGCPRRASSTAQRMPSASTAASSGSSVIVTGPNCKSGSLFSTK